MTTELRNGTTVAVPIPPRVPTVSPPPLPSSDGVTLPAQGSLTPAQIASIVREVTAKVLAELGGQQPGGGGAGIDDTAIGTGTTWSSRQIVNDRAPMNVTILDEEGNPSDELPITDAVQSMYVGLSYAWQALDSAAVLTNEINGAPIYPLVYIVEQLPEVPDSNTIYLVRDPDTGALAPYLPTLWV